MATQSMFTNPYDAQMSQEAARRKEMRDVAQMDAYDYHAYQAGMAGQDLARGLGGMLGMQTPEDAKQAKIEEVMGQFGEGKKTPEQLMQIADSFRAAGMLDLWEEVMGMAKDAGSKATDRKVIEGADGFKYFQDTQERVLPGVEKAPDKEEAPITAADRIIFNNFVEKSGKLKGAQDFADYKQSLKEKQAQAGTDFGSVKPEDITKMMGRWDTEVGSIEDSVATIDNARDLLDQAIAGNATAYEQVNRFLIKVVGDSQISNLEVQNMVKAGSLPERLSQTLTYWASGIPTQTKAEDIKAILGALNENSKMRINKKRARYRASYSSTPLPAKTIETIFGSDYDLGTSVNDATIDDIDAAIAAKSGVK
jgi:hypothetical protein